ncbi:MAG: hypothetical protein ACMXYC_01245 [Candidatus Woesearchaeota archaeon]
MHELLNEKGVRTYIKEMSIAKDFCEALERHIKQHIDTAIMRAKANQRNTVMSRDL